jgi:hypothetical protein
MASKKKKKKKRGINELVKLEFILLMVRLQHGVRLSMLFGNGKIKSIMWKIFKTLCFHGFRRLISLSNIRMLLRLKAGVCCRIKIQLR